ncbi:MAG TPA: hypothetical protein VGD27_04195 [Longimicrobiales bacterium]
MARSYQRMLFRALLVLTPIFTACERAADINGITADPMPATVAFKSAEVRVVTRVVGGTTGYAISDYVTRNKTATLQVGKYQLYVPRGAVKKPTRFMMVVLDSAFIGVRLYAFDKEWKPVTHFHVPVELTLPYDEASADEIRAGELRIANVVSETDPTILELVSAEVDADSQTVTGSLYHFSVWTLALQLTKELSPGID